MNPGLRTIRLFLSPGRVVQKPLSVNPEQNKLKVFVLLFFVCLSFSLRLFKLKTEGQYKQKTSSKSYKIEIKIHAKPGWVSLIGT